MRQLQGQQEADTGMAMQFVNGRPLDVSRGACNSNMLLCRPLVVFIGACGRNVPLCTDKFVFPCLCTPVLMKQAPSASLFTVDLGNLAAMEEAVITFAYVRVLDTVAGALEFVHTATWVPPYIGSRDVATHSKQEVRASLHDSPQAMACAACKGLMCYCFGKKRSGPSPTS